MLRSRNGQGCEARETAIGRRGVAFALPQSMRALLVVTLVGCAYKPGSFTHTRHAFVGQRTTVGCLDLAIERRPDLPTGGTVLAYEFGNRCDRATTIDLAQARVEGRTFGGETLTLAPYDPAAEIRPLLLDARSAGGEAIAYPARESLAEVCIDAASIARTGVPRWLCFAANTPPPVLAEVSP